jgi:hypothetical protein
MHWLDSTFANRFNRYRGEHGHLFPGRYKRLLAEEDSAVAVSECVGVLRKEIERGG